MRIRDQSAVDRRRAYVARVMDQAAAKLPTPATPAPTERRSMKAKVHTVELNGTRYLVMARTKAGARRDLIEHIVGEAHADLATGEDIYDAACEGQEIIGRDKYRDTVDPNQMPLEGVPETVAKEAQPKSPF